MSFIDDLDVSNFQFSPFTFEGTKYRAIRVEGSFIPYSENEIFADPSLYFDGIYNQQIDLGFYPFFNADELEQDASVWFTTVREYHTPDKVVSEGIPPMTSTNAISY